MRKPDFKNRYFAFTLGAAIVSVLVILGVLQYRWSNQVSEANEAQIGANLRSLMMDWHFDLFRDFSSIAVALQVGPDSGARDDWRDYLGRYMEWQNTALNPEIVQSVFIWQTSAAGDEHLFLLDTTKSEPVLTDVPPDMKALLDHLQANSGSLQRGLNAWSQIPVRSDTGEKPQSQDTRRTDPMTGWQFDARIPA